MKKLVIVTLAITGFVFAQGCTCSKQEEPAAVEAAPEAAPEAVPTETAPTDGTAVPTETAPAETAPTGN